MCHDDNKTSGVVDENTCYAPSEVKVQEFDVVCLFDIEFILILLDPVIKQTVYKFSEFVNVIINMSISSAHVQQSILIKAYLISLRVIPKNTNESKELILVSVKIF